MTKHAIAVATALLCCASAPPVGRVTIFTGDKAAVLLHQCSRRTPVIGEAWYRPDGTQISELEDAVVRRARGTGPMTTADHVTFNDVADLRSRYAVEIAGIIRNGRHYVYGSFMPIGDSGPEHGGPTIICDGGISLFGAEYDVQTHAITQFAENGAI